MKNKNIPIVATFLILLSIISITLVPLCLCKDFTDIKVLSSRGEITSDGYYDLVGEVQNTGSTALYSIDLLATFYDSNNSVLGQSHPFSIELQALQPGAKSPFHTILFSTLTWITKIDHYDLQVAIADDFNLFNFSPGLQILSNRSYTDDKGMIHFEGELKNTGTKNSNNTRVFITLYDSSGKVVDAKSIIDFSSGCIVSSYDIAAGDTTTFSYLYLGETERVESYTLTVESYSGDMRQGGYGLVLNQLNQSPLSIQPSPEPSVPEFPFFVLLSLFGLLFLMTVLVKKSYFLTTIWG